MEISPGGLRAHPMVADAGVAGGTCFSTVFLRQLLFTYFGLSQEADLQSATLTFIQYVP